MPETSDTILVFDLIMYLFALLNRGFGTIRKALRKNNTIECSVIFNGVMYQKANVSTCESCTFCEHFIGSPWSYASICYLQWSVIRCTWECLKEAWHGSCTSVTDGVKAHSLITYHSLFLCFWKTTCLVPIRALQR